MKKNIDNKAKPCPLATSLSVLGDKWTLLILRDLIQGKRRYGDFASSDENIPTNILANRLKRLLEYELIAKQAYQTRPTRYEYVLTDSGCELLPSIQALAKWGNDHFDCKQPPKWFFDLTIEELKNKESIFQT